MSEATATEQSDFIEAAIADFAEKLLQAGICTYEHLYDVEMRIAGMIDDAETHGWPKAHAERREAA